MALRGSVTEKVPIEAGQLFAVITDLDRLPEWNTIIRRVVEQPSALARDAEWVVELSTMGRTWQSRSTLVDHDSAALRFAYRSRTDDGNVGSASEDLLAAHAARPRPQPAAEA
jgi:Polyketide cyclase / dehydrase and lipid transport